MDKVFDARARGAYVLERDWQLFAICEDERTLPEDGTARSSIFARATSAGAFARKLEYAASDMETTPDPTHIKALVRNLETEARDVAAQSRA